MISVRSKIIQRGGHGVPIPRPPEYQRHWYAMIAPDWFVIRLPAKMISHKTKCTIYTVYHNNIKTERKRETVERSVTALRVGNSVTFASSTNDFFFRVFFSAPKPSSVKNGNASVRHCAAWIFLLLHVLPMLYFYTATRRCDTPLWVLLLLRYMTVSNSAP
jgi:hypothetical protein